jgi:signal transduction histidine kinase
MDATAEQALARDPAELNDDSSARLSRSAAIAELGQLALLGQDVNGLLRVAVGLLREVLGVEYSKVLHQPAFGEPLVLMAGSGWQDHVEWGVTTVPCDTNSQAGYTLLSDEPVFVEDLGVETRFVGPQLLRDHGVVSGMSVLIRGPDRPYGVLGVHGTRRRRFSAEDGDYLRAVANILGSALASRRTVEQADQTARYNTALAVCAQNLLDSSGEDRIQHALEALFVATEATYVFVERNLTDPELGFCSQVVAEAEAEDATDFELDNEYWELVPWEKMQTSRKALEVGEPIVIVPEELTGPEYDQYAADPYPVKSELEVPIFVDGEWAGLIGFADQTIVREWTDTDLSLLTTTAAMIGAFWERDEAQKRLEQANQAKDAFLASVSHELRTPLTAIVGYGEILLEESDSLSDEEREELTRTVVRQGGDLANIVNDLLLAARADINRLHVTQVPLNLRDEASRVLDSFDQDNVAGIRITGESITAVGDPERVRQIVRNLISNALRYGGNTIRVEVSSEEATAKALVCDNGTAIPDDDRQKIFQPYQRAQNTPGLTESLGLGLAISRQLAQLMGGDLTYRHQGGESIFEFTLPTTV